MQIAELRAAAQQFPQDQRGPTLAEHFGALGDRAELTIALHGDLLVQSPARAGIRRRVTAARKYRFCTNGSVQIRDWIVQPLRIKSVHHVDDACAIDGTDRTDVNAQLSRAIAAARPPARTSSTNRR